MRRVERFARHLEAFIDDAGSFEPLCQCSRCRRAQGEESIAAGAIQGQLCSSKSADTGELRVFTKEELQQFNGMDKPQVFLALKGDVFDVTPGFAFYGPAGAYEVLGGRDASRALGKMDLDKSAVENPHLEDFDEKDHKTLNDWHTRMSSKYTLVGKLKND